MKKHTIAALLAAALLAPCAAWADFGGTTENTISLGASFAYDPSTIAGSELSLDLHGGLFMRDNWLLGGILDYEDNDVVTTYEIAALSQWHFLDEYLADENGVHSAFSPYGGVMLGLAHGKTAADSDTGAMAGLRLGFDIFFSQNTALDCSVDFKFCTGDVYPDDHDMKSSDIAFRVGIGLFF